MRALFERIGAAGRSEVDVASLAAFRIVFGLVMCGGIIRFLATGWIEPMYGEPTWFFKYPGFGWVQAWSVTAMYVHYIILAIFALAIAFGAFHRIACVLFTLGFAYTQLIDVTNYLNHNYLVVLLGGLLTCLPANALWSIDARRRPAVRRATIPAWMVWLVRFQVGVVYVFAGLAKAKADWLVHAQPLDLWLAARTHTPLIGPWLDEPWVATLASWAGFAFDTTIVAWLSWRRTRLVAYGALIMFHGLTGYLFNIGMFPIIMTTAALIFFPPAWPRRFFGDGLAVKPHGGSPMGQPVNRPLVVAAWIYVALQLALPLRHLVYPGNVLWNEDGMRFAWHVKVREKDGDVMFVARFANGRSLRVPPRGYLTARQEREMAGQPDLILQLAHHVGNDLRTKGYPAFTLHAETAVSLNGRRPIAMIDPGIDLLAVEDCGERTWVLDEPHDIPPVLRPLTSKSR